MKFKAVLTDPTCIKDFNSKKFNWLVLINDWFSAKHLVFLRSAKISLEQFHVWQRKQYWRSKMTSWLLWTRMAPCKALFCVGLLLAMRTSSPVTQWMVLVQSTMKSWWPLIQVNSIAHWNAAEYRHEDNVRLSIFQLSYRLLWRCLKEERRKMWKLN